MLMGEVPGDHEDKQGHVFVGPAGHLLDEALADAGIDRDGVYLTNAVKHFKFVPKPRRQGAHPQDAEPQPKSRRAGSGGSSELEVVKPKVLGLLGRSRGASGARSAASASRSSAASGSSSTSGVCAIATVHPSAVLRAEERRDRGVRRPCP